MVAREEDSVDRVVEAEVVVGVAGGVEGQPGTTTQDDLLAVDHGVGRLGYPPGPGSAGHVHLRPLTQFFGGRCGSGGAPWGGAVHHRSDLLEVLVVGQVQFSRLHFLVDGCVHPYRPEVGMGEDPGAVVVAEAVHPSEVVGVAVGHHCGVDP